MARKVVGVGSIGTRAWVLLFVGRRGKDPLVLQMKEAQASVLESHLGPSEFENHGERVVHGQRMDQAVSDVFLGWQRSQGLDGKKHDFYMRQLWDWKASFDLSTMTELGLRAYTRACGWSLARALARSGERIAIAAYLGASAKFDEAIARFSTAYADQNELDYQRLADAVAAGEVGPRPASDPALETTRKACGRREVPLSQRALAALDALPPRLPHVLLFPAPAGGLLNLDHFRRRHWAPAIEASGVQRRARTYDLGSTFASRPLAAGVPVFELSKVMGSSVRMIEQHYGTLLDGAGAGIASRLDAYDAEQAARALGV